MNHDNTSLDELIAAYNNTDKPSDLRWAIVKKIGEARLMLRHYRAFLTNENITSLNANIRKAKAALG